LRNGIERAKKTEVSRHVRPKPVATKSRREGSDGREWERRDGDGRQGARKRGSTRLGTLKGKNNPEKFQKEGPMVYSPQLSLRSKGGGGGSDAVRREALGVEGEQLIEVRDKSKKIKVLPYFIYLGEIVKGVGGKEKLFRAKSTFERGGKTLVTFNSYGGWGNKAPK